jgi:16S rRNA processing protein RimM
MSEVVEVVVGRIGRAHGVRGEVTIDVRSDSPDERFVPGVRLRGTRAHQERTFVVERAKWHSGRLLVMFEGFIDRNMAEEARGFVLSTQVPADELPDDPNEFYDHQLIGLRVLDQLGAERGTVTDLTHGAQDLLHIKTPDGERLVPFVEALVPTVDVVQGFVVVADRPGLLVALED